MLHSPIVSAEDVDRISIGDHGVFAAAVSGKGNENENDLSELWFIALVVPDRRPHPARLPACLPPLPTDPLLLLLCYRRPLGLQPAKGVCLLTGPRRTHHRAGGDASDAPSRRARSSTSGTRRCPNSCGRNRRWAPPWSGRPSWPQPPWSDARQAPGPIGDYNSRHTFLPSQRKWRSERVWLSKERLQFPAYLALWLDFWLYSIGRFGIDW